MNHPNRRALLPVMLIGLAAFTGACGDDGDTRSGSGSGDAQDARPVRPPATPQETLRQFAASVADNDATRACGLMLEGTRFLFAQENEAPDCATAVSVLSSKIADAAAYKAMVPSGLEVTGDLAEVSGYCGEGWRTADGGRYEADGDSPNALGTITLRKTAQGWLITEYRSANRYSSCGG